MGKIHEVTCFVTEVTTDVTVATRFADEAPRYNSRSLENINQIIASAVTCDTELRTKLEERMQHPWVGKSYGASDNVLGGKKLLVVGESHYGTQEPVGVAVPSLTCEVVSNYQSGEWKIPFLTRIATMITGVPAWKNGIRSKTLWDDLAFYNYIPVLVGKAPRQFDWSLWALGSPEFRDVLTTTSPDMIIVMGYRLWDNAYFRHTDGSLNIGQRSNMLTATIDNERRIPTLVIQHPSSPGFSGIRRHPDFKAIFDTI